MKHVLRAVALISLFLASLLIGLVGASPAFAAGTCDDIATGPGWEDQVDTPGDPKTVTVTAREGFLIDKYCVKAGSANQGEGPVIVPVVPPDDEVTIDHPTRDSISHYKIHLIPIPDETETPTTETPTTETPGGPIVDNPPVVDNPEPQAPPALPATGAEETLWALGALGLALLMAGVSLVARRARS